MGGHNPEWAEIVSSDEEGADDEHDDRRRDPCPRPKCVQQ
jgi:hypothetical protein